MAIAALDLLAHKTLAEKTLVTTVMSNAGLEAAVKSAGGRVIRTAVGDRNVIDEMLRGGFNFGGEQSGHLIFRDFSTTGDGLVAALQVLSHREGQTNTALKTGEMLDALSATRHQRPRAREKAVRAARWRVKLVKQAEAELKSAGGRVLLRYSGTEPKARLLLEGRDAKVLEKWSQKICAAIQKQIGA